MSDVIPVRTTRGRAVHALPETGGVTTLCGRLATKLKVCDGFPNCKTCLRRIARITSGVGG